MGNSSVVKGMSDFDYVVDNWHDSIRGAFPNSEVAPPAVHK